MREEDKMGLKHCLGTFFCARVSLQKRTGLVHKNEGGVGDVQGGSDYH